MTDAKYCLRYASTNSNATFSVTPNTGHANKLYDNVKL